MRYLTYIIVSVSGKVDVSFLVFHVYCNASDLRQHVLVVTEVSQQVHNGVANLTIYRLTKAHTDQRAGVICKNINKVNFLSKRYMYRLTYIGLCII